MASWREGLKDSKEGNKDSKSFLQALEKVGIKENSERALMVGDSLERDLILANKAVLKQLLPATEMLKNNRF